MNYQLWLARGFIASGVLGACSVDALDYRGKSCANGQCPAGLICVPKTLVCELPSTVMNGGSGGNAGGKNALGGNGNDATGSGGTRSDGIGSGGNANDATGSGGNNATGNGGNGSGETGNGGTVDA